MSCACMNLAPGSALAEPAEAAVQLGLINFNPNGFLPVFPLFNYGR
jgi:hypothetical protein